MKKYVSKDTYYECRNCYKPLNTGDTAYKDGYFGQLICSWECMVEYMSDFFGVDEESTITVEKDD